MRFAPFKIIVNSADSAAVSKLHIDDEIPWNSICHFVMDIDGFAESLSNEQLDKASYKCPICLIPLCNLPRITKCGHMFW